jgi:hypothetical protein
MPQSNYTSSMKRLFLLWLLLASFVANAQSIPGISARPPGLPDFSPFRLDPFSFSFQIKKPYIVEGPITAEVYSGNTRIIDSTDIDLVVNDNYVTVSFTKSQIGALPNLSTCYIIWNGTRQLSTNLKPGMGSGTVSRNKIEVGIVEVQIVGDSHNSMVAADRSEAARDTAIIKSLSAKQYADSASAAKAIADAKSTIATQQATIATSAADSTLTLRSQSLTYRNDAIAAKDTALHYAVVTDSLTALALISKDSAQAAQVIAVTARNQAENFKNIAEAASGAAVSAKKFQTTWNVATNNPNLSALSLTTSDAGKYWEVNVAGSSALTGSSQAYEIGDGVVWNGTVWVKTLKSDLALQKALALETKIPSKNLANSALFTDGFYLENDGIPTVLASYGYTDFMAVVPGLQYTGWDGVNGMRKTTYYNSSKAVVVGGSTNNITTFTVPAGVYYVKVTYVVARKSTFQFEQSATATSFLAFGKAELQNTNVGAALVTQDATHRFAADTEKTTWNAKVDQSAVASESIGASKNIFDKTNIVSDSFINTGSGQFATAVGWIRTGPIPCDASTSYTIQGLVTLESKAVRFEDAAGNYLSFLGAPGVTVGTTMTFATPALAAKMYINIQRSTETVNVNIVQVEKGSSATGYVAFVAGVEKLKSVNGKKVPFLTIAGKTGDTNGAVLLDKADVGLSLVNNTADASKPVSTPQQTALNLKLDQSQVVSEVIGVTRNIFDKTNVVVDGFINTGSGQFGTLAGWIRTGPITCTGSTTYTVQGLITRQSKVVRFETEAGAFISFLPEPSPTTGTTFTFTTPSNATKMYMNVQRSGETVNLNIVQIELGSSATTYVPYNAGTKTLVSVSGAQIPAGVVTQLKKPVTLVDCERMYLGGDSYSVGYNSLPGKNYLTALSMFSDWNFDNYSKSGDATNMILARLVANTPQYKGITPKQLKGGGYAIIISFTNDVNNSVINSTDQLNTYLNNIRLLAEAFKSLGYKPIVATEYHASGGTNGTGLLQAAISQFCNDNGYIFMDVYEKSRYLKGATNFSFYWDGSHPNLRTNAIFWTNMKPYIDALPRPKWSIKVFRKRDSTAVSTVADLMYISNLDRAKKFKEILLTGQAMNSASYSKYDDQSNWTSTGNIVDVGEYYDLINGSTIAMGDYSLMEVVINSTAAQTSKLDIQIGTVDAVYAKNHITQAWVSLPIVSGVVTLSDLYSQIKYDKVSLLIVKSGGWNMAAPQVDFYGVEGKSYYQKSLSRELRTAELVTTRNFNSGTTGWTVTGTITPSVPEDNGSMPTGITQIATISTGNSVSQAVTFSSAGYKRKAQVKVISRRNPPRYSSLNTFPTGSPISLDSYDFANVKLNITKSSNVVTFKDVIGMHWTESVFEFDVAAGDTTFTVGIQKDDKDFELADVSVKIE